MTRVKTDCVSAILTGLGLDLARVRWTYNADRADRRNVWPDTLRRHGFAVRSRRSRLKSTATVADLQRALAAGRMADDPPRTVYVARVPGHVLLLSNDGRKLIDTDPREVERRRLLGVVAVWRAR